MANGTKILYFFVLKKTKPIKKRFPTNRPNFLEIQPEGKITIFFLWSEVALGVFAKST